MTRRDLVPWIGVLARVGGAALWIVAGAAKVGELATFEYQVEQYKLLPHFFTAPFAYALPFVEIFVGLYLLVGLLTRVASLAACFLLVLFLIAQTQAWARGLSVECGCFGALTREHVSLWSVLRDVGLLVPFVILAIWPARKLSLDRFWLGLTDRFALPAR